MASSSLRTNCFFIACIDRLWAYPVERSNFGPGYNSERARRMFDQAREHCSAKISRFR